MEQFGFASIQDIPLVVNILKVLITGMLAFIIAFLITPLWTNILYKYKCGIRIKTNSVDGEKLSIVSNLHKNKTGTPTMGGVLIWFTVGILVLASHYLFPLLAQLFDMNFIARLDFFSRKEVWLPLFFLLMSAHELE